MANRLVKDLEEVDDALGVVVAALLSVTAGVILCPLLVLMVGWMSQFMPAAAVRAIGPIAGTIAWTLVGWKIGAVGSSPKIRVTTTTWIAGFAIPGLCYYTIATWLAS